MKCTESFDSVIRDVPNTDVDKGTCTNNVDPIHTHAVQGTECPITCASTQYEFVTPAMNKYTCEKGANVGKDIATTEGTWEGMGCVAGTLLLKMMMTLI